MALLAALLCAPEARAQQHRTGGNEGKRPIGWRVRYDAGEHAGHGADSISFVQMTPGFHATTAGAAAILWHPDSVARGSYTVESTIFLFPTKGRDREGYGLFIGGQQLDGDAQQYVYFLLRNDGRFLVKTRTGATTRVMQDWTPHAAIKRQTGSDAVQNDLRVTAGSDSVRFAVNGTVVATVPTTRLMVDGVFGLRLNHAVNAHVSRIARVSK